jgi:hypothetical protein
MNETMSLATLKNQPTNALANTDQSRAVAEVQAAIMSARMAPRDTVKAIDRILNACTRPALAEVAVYSYGRGGQEVTGPSIRLAEALAQNWGNMQFGLREIEQRNGESTVQAYAWDVETNTRREVTFQVHHVRYTRAGRKELEDPRDIYEMVANQGARRLRACILSIIPGDVVESAVAQCETTLQTKIDTSPEAIKKMIAAFESFGVTKEQIEKRIQRRLDTIVPAQMAGLRKIFTSLKDGMSSASDWFESAAVSAADIKKQTPEEPKKPEQKQEQLEQTQQNNWQPTPEEAAAIKAAEMAEAEQQQQKPNSRASRGSFGNIE